MQTTASWISKTPDECGGNARVRDTRIEVWVLVQFRLRGWSDAEFLRYFSSLTPADLEAAWEYAAENGEDIDRRIREDDADREGEVMRTSASWISKRPGYHGGDACVRHRRIPVWVLANYRRLGMSDAGLIESYPQLTPADLEAAFEYAAANPDEIDQAIRENEEGEEGFVE